MMGSITFLPTFLQYVSGASATSSGLRMLPMVIGLLLTAIASGTIVGKTGKYKIFPIAGSAVTALGLYLLSLLDENTAAAAGIGLFLHPRRRHRPGHAGADADRAEHRQLPGSRHGDLRGDVLPHPGRVVRRRGARQHLLEQSRNRSAARRWYRHPGFPPAAATSPEQLWALPVDLRTPVVEVYAAALHNVFLYAVPVALLALVVAFFLPQVTLRGREGAGGTGEGFAIPEGADADTQLENIIGEVLRKKGSSAAPDVLARIRQFARHPRRPGA